MKWLVPALIALSFAAPARAQRLDGIAAVVNDDVVLESDVEEQLALLVQRAQSEPDSVTLDTLRSQILNQLVDEKLIVAEAKRQGITTTEAEVNKELEDAIRDAKERLGGEDGFRQQLQRENTTEAKLRERYRGDIQRQLIARKLLQKALPNRPVTPAEAEQYFKDHRDQFPKVPAELRLSVIQIPAEPDSAAAAAARGKALAIRRRILAGEKFAKVAGEVSDDPATARNGGDLGFLEAGRLDEALDREVFSGKIGELSQPVRSAVGWHILEVLDRDTLRTRAGKDSLDARGEPLLEAHVRHILVHVPIGDEDVARARAHADRVLKEARTGTDFAALVRRHSKYTGPADETGDVGYVSLASLQPQIRAGLEALEVGQVSDVLVNSAGFNIFKVTGRRAEREYELDEIREELPEVVSQMKQRERYDTWIQTLRSKAHIEIRGT